MTAEVPAGIPDSSPPLLVSRPLSDWRGKFSTGVLWCVLVLGLLILTPSVYFSLGSSTTLVFVILWAVLGLIALWRGSFNVRVIASLVILAASGVASIIGGESPWNGTFFFLGFVTIAAMLWSPKAGAVATPVAIILIAGLGILADAGLLGSAGNAAAMQSVAGWIGASLAVLLFGVGVVVGFSQMQRRSDANVPAVGGTDKPGAEAADLSGTAKPSLLRSALEVVRNAHASRNPSELAGRLPRLVRAAFDYPSVVLYLTNKDRDQLVPSGSAGAPAPPADTGPAVSMAGDSLAAMAARNRRPEQREDRVGAESVAAEGINRSPGAVLALPLIAADRVLGVLELHRESADPVGADELAILKDMAEQVAVALDTARLLEEATQDQSPPSRDAEQEVRRTWESLLGSGALEYNVGEEGSREGEPKFEIPLSVRDEAIGSISLTSQTDWSADQRTLVEAIATQAALALENARLVEETQLSARREHVIADITAKVWASTSIDGVLRTTLRELAQVLGADEASIELSARMPNDQ